MALTTIFLVGIMILVCLMAVLACYLAEFGREILFMEDEYYEEEDEENDEENESSSEEAAQRGRYY